MVLTMRENELTCLCLRCGHTWQSDTVRMLLDAGMLDAAAEALAKAPPKRCAKCKSAMWQHEPIRKPRFVMPNVADGE